MASDRYERYCRPAVAAVLKAIRMDVRFHRAEGDVLYFLDEDGAEVAVTDFLGGYGASLLGHNHPRIVGVAQTLLQSKVPFNAQMSVRGYAAQLAERLDARLFGLTGRHYVTTFANSGTEAVEAAIKHARYAYLNRIDQAVARLEEALESIMATLGSLEQKVTVRWDTATVEESGVPENLALPWHGAVSFGTLRQWLADLLAPLRGRHPLIVAQKGSFHGKTTGSLSLTENPAYRAPFGVESEHVAFVARDDVAALQAVFDQARRRIPIPVLSEGREILLRPLDLYGISACILEPIQGEGGINPLTGPYLRYCREITQRCGVPLVIDEIQSGMGRTGAFLCATPHGIRPDYLVLSKSLGGGVAKISALLISTDHYIEDFGLLHTSTFAEDDFSCAVALETLAVIDDDRLMERAQATGERLRQALGELVAEFPDLLREVSGQGLMLGLKFHRQNDSECSSIRLLAREELLGYVISGYLFHLHRTRVAPSLSNGSVIRIEPSAYIDKAACEHLVAALRDVCHVLRRHQSHLLLQYIVGRCEAHVSALHPDYRAVNRPFPQQAATGRKIGFVGHFIDHRDVALWDPALENFTPAEQKAFLDRVFGILSPDHTDEVDVESPNGDKVRLIFSGICATSQHFDAALRARDVATLRGKVQQAVDLLAALGCETIGLGAYTSIITNNCEALRSRGTALTSGNSLTVGMGLEALRSAAAELGILWPEVHLSVIGATGNIASTYSELAAESVASLNLVGRSEAGLKRLRRLANRIYADGLKRLLERDQPPQGIARRLLGTRLLEQAAASPESLGSIDWYHLARAELGEDAPLSVTADMTTVTRSNAVVCASNSAHPVLLESHLGPHPTAICDISVPPDVHPAIHEKRPTDVKVVRGGNVRITSNPEFRLKGCSLPPGQVFACMAETVLLGLTGIGGHYTYGPVVKSNVRKVMDLSRFHGFALTAKGVLSSAVSLD